MSKPLTGIKIALLIANGFCEQDMTETQRALTAAGANVRIVSPEQGLVNGWTGEGWGHHFAVDATLSTALGADYAMVVLPGGKRSHDKLKLTAHTRRFVSGFVAAHKPIVSFGDTLQALVADAPAEAPNILSAAVDAGSRPAFIQAIVEFFAAQAANQAAKAVIGAIENALVLLRRHL